MPSMFRGAVGKYLELEGDIPVSVICVYMGKLHTVYSQDNLFIKTQTYDRVKVDEGRSGGRKMPVTFTIYQHSVCTTFVVNLLPGLLLHTRIEAERFYFS